MALTSRFQEALILAFSLHADQKRKGTSVPYIAHLLGVTSLVLENGADEDEAIAALLHDAVEDQGGIQTRRLIQQRFGERVAQIVDGLSDSHTTPKPPWRESKEKYLAHLRQADASVRLVSAADKLYNACSILKDYQLHGEPIWDRFRGGKEGTLWYYHSLVELFMTFEPTPLTTELAQVVAELEALVASREQGSV
ncbi:MAG: HD domain-containing protein [Chloroflexi bacterium]|nr:HD domain-containing protein [Chloroflexota bacterium]